MKHPSAEKCHQLADLFYLLAVSNKSAKVDMAEFTFHPCDTIACHAGWFAVSQNKNWSCVFGYQDSANEMANFLGFSHRDQLALWADINEEFWGNRFGSDMFCSRRAFGKSENVTLMDISRHWRKVAERLERIKQ